MILLVKDKNNIEEKYYLNNNNRRDIEVCLDDIERLSFYGTQILKKVKKEFSREEQSTKYLRLLDSGYIYELDIMSMWVNNLDLPADERENCFAIKFAPDLYLHLKISRYGNKYKYEKKNLKFTVIKLDNIYSSQNQLVFSVENDFDGLKSSRKKMYDFVLRWRSYYDMKLTEVSNLRDVIKATVDLEELRNQFSFWQSVIEDNKIYLPVKVNDLIPTRSTSIIISKYQPDGTTRSVDILKDYINVKFRILSKNKNQAFIESALNDFDYKIKSDIAVIEFEDDCEWVIKEFDNRNISEITIKQNIAGESERIRRIIFGIDQIMNSEEVNSNLIGQIVYNKLLDNNDYVIDQKRIERIVSEYHLNDEQALVVDKILNMNDLFLVQGPPGTGKTEIISTIVKELNKENKIVLLTSNVAEARRNITDRIKGEKELIIKDYTDLKDDSDKHKKEVLKNKLNYIGNQIIEKFTFEEDFICTEVDYQKLLSILSSNKEKLKYIDNLIQIKQGYEQNKAQKEKEIEIMSSLIEKFEEESETIYKLIIKDDLENIDKNILLNFIEQFLVLFNNTKLPRYVEKINYSKKKIDELKYIKSSSQKIALFKKFIHSESMSDDVIEKNFIDEYSKTSELKKILFNLSDVIPMFKIDDKNKKQSKEIILENEKRIKHISYEEVKSEFDLLKEQFCTYLNNVKISYDQEKQNIVDLIMDSEEKIQTEKNKNFNLNGKIKKLEDFLNSYDSIKELYPNKELFYSYLKELNNIMIIGKDNEKSYYIENMLSGNYFNRIFKYDNTLDGTILSMSTSQVAKFLKYTDINFDYIIVDEASKCNFNDLIVSLSRTKKMVLIGDYLQLDPVPEERDVEFLDETQWNHIQLSNFSQLIRPVVEEKFNQKTDYQKSNSIGILKKQYRMSEEIFEIIESIYESIDGFGIIDGKKEFTNPNLKYKNLLSIQCDGKESERDLEDSSRYNLKEIEMVVEIMNYVLNLKKSSSINNINKIGIISFYKRQSTLINNKIIKIKDELKKYGVKVEVGTVDNFQGREFDLVILSCVRTEEITSFIKQIRRWNVAISRAKDKLITIGNFEKLNDIASKTIINKNESQEKKEIAVVFEKIIPNLYEKREKFSSIEEIVNEFLKGGNENE